MGVQATIPPLRGPACGDGTEKSAGPLRSGWQILVGWERCAGHGWFSVHGSQLTVSEKRRLERTKKNSVEARRTNANSGRDGLRSQMLAAAVAKDGSGRNAW